MASGIKVSPRTSSLEERRIVVLGKTGSGKSTTCNNILGGEFFKSEPYPESVTKKCGRKTRERFGKNIQIIDTPGLFDTGMTNMECTQEIVKCIAMTAPGPHAFIMILQIGRFTEEEQNTVKYFKSLFGEDMMKYLLVLFTGKDDINRSRVTIQQFVERASPVLKDLIISCENRYTSINNVGQEDEREIDVKYLMKQVDNIYHKNSGRYYTNDIFKKAEEEMSKRQEELRREFKANEMLKLQQEFKELKTYHAEQICQVLELSRIKDAETEMKIKELEAELERKKQELEDSRMRMVETKSSQDSEFRERARQEANDGVGVFLKVLQILMPVVMKVVDFIFSSL